MIKNNYILASTNFLYLFLNVTLFLNIPRSSRKIVLKRMKYNSDGTTVKNKVAISLVPFTPSYRIECS